MEYVIGLLVLLLGLLVSIALHEVGHMVPAKRFGVRVSKYMVGFGPTLWSRTRGETEYGLKAIPLGGYVRLIGMFPPADVVGAQPRPGRIGELVTAVREQSAEEVLPGQEQRAFYRLSTPKKLVVMLGGPFMNLLIAAVLLLVVLVGIGLPALSTTVGVVGDCVRPITQEECAPGDPPVPAAQAGLEPGDELVSLDGAPVESWADFQAAVAASDGSSVPLVVERAGERLTLELAPVLADRPVFDDETGAMVLDEDGQVVTEETRYVGLSPTRELQPQPISAVPGEVGRLFAGTAEVVLTLPARLWDVVQAVVGVEERDASSVIGPVGVGRVAGEIAAADVDLTWRVASLLQVLASLNMALFVFNLIPLLPLDGGHVVGALWEGGKRQVARLRGLPRPAPADVARMMPLAYGVFAVLALMGVLLLYADLVAPVTLG
ncbi:RIP metalloprotease [Actinotalea ferrariae]|uniref:M50 family metallopeptidase n=1 Tax=Actinotalea ferrariae TaxID=1386098 RepID=UPI001C8B3A8F|nr:RIP metalloprotease [Actinotalea ferrariae]MBX9246334.1 RIP metalloprotease [Actinotalea ferrariae]